MPVGPMRPPSSFGFPCRGPAILLQSFTLCYPSSVCPGFTTYFFLLQVLFPVSLRASPQGQLPIPHPPRVSVSAAAVAYLRSVPLRRISNVSSRRCGNGSGHRRRGLQTADCRREGVGDRQKRFRWLSHVPFFFDLPCLLAFFSPLRRDLFFLYCASLWVTLYDNLRHVLDMEENEGIWELEGRLLDGAQLDPALGMY